MLGTDTELNDSRRKSFFPKRNCRGKGEKGERKTEKKERKTEKKEQRE